MIVLGVDPGLSGALCVYNGIDVELADIPTCKLAGKRRYDLPEIVSYLFGMVGRAVNSKEKMYAVVEKVSGRPGEGIVSSRTIGYGEGIWHMAFTIYGIPYESVAPQTWKKEYGLIGADKKASIAIAKQRFPSASLDRQKDHNRAEAILLALWEWERRR